MATNDEHVIQYKGDHEGRVLTKLNRLRKRKVFTDVTFKLEDGEVSAQKSILAGYSDYYEKMFTSGFKEGFNKDIEIKEMKASILDLLFTFIYLQVIDISDKTVCQLYEASDYLQLNDVKGYCVSFFNDALAVGNCLSFRSFAQRYQLLELVGKCDKFIVDNLELVSKEFQFMELSVNEAEALIALKQKQDSCQDSIFRTILNWIKHDFKQRQQFIEQLFQLIDVKKLSTAFLEEVVKESERWIKRLDFYFDVLNPEYIARLKNQPDVPGGAVKHGGAREEATFEFMIVGGRGTEKLVQIYDVVGKHLREIRFYPQSTLYERWASTSVKINNHVYTTGGHRSNVVECLNLNQVDGDWYKVASMNETRWGAASSVLNDQMCVAGGRDSGNNVLSSVELYNPVVNIWTNIASMQTERLLHALVSCNDLKPHDEQIITDYSLCTLHSGTCL
uniref:kelch-like protein 12 isoform X1 n=1 Tax=Ciona intestinalis TaxID=7719 RepID=UPI000EF48A03|nr:kelch-like protein 12 isoform X1 [Ciona intestinalis]|eukprot:XP_026695392.1 kelch-like protein 12 isoform X1 [Ciona intestinalis]